MDDMARQRSMSTIGFASNSLNSSLLNALQQAQAQAQAQAGSASVPQSPLCSTPMQQQQQQSPAMRPGSMSLPNSRRSSFVGSLSSSPVGMMSPGGPNSAQPSAPSTPISVMSPGMNPAYRSIPASPVEPSNSFMPIQNIYQDSSAGVNLVRPMVTVASVMAQANVSNPQVAQTPLLQGSGSGFVPYPFGTTTATATATKVEQDLQQQFDLNTDNAVAAAAANAIAQQLQQHQQQQQQGINLSMNQFNSAVQSAMLSSQNQQQQQQSLNMQGRNPPPAYNIALQQQANNNQNIGPQLTLQQRLEQHQKTIANNRSKEDGKFAPVSSIKPVKRGGKGSKPAASAKRQRHRSAQPAIGRNCTAGGNVASSTVSAAQSRPMASKNALLQALLSGTTPTANPSLQTTHHATGSDFIVQGQLLRNISRTLVCMSISHISPVNYIHPLFPAKYIKIWPHKSGYTVLNFYSGEGDPNPLSGTISIAANCSSEELKFV